MRIGKNVISGWTQIFLSLLYTLLITPVAINNLGREMYGLWILIFNIVGYLYLTDFGVTNSISRLYAKYNILKEINKLKAMIHTIFILIFLIDLIIILLAYVFHNNVKIFLNINQNMNNIFIVIFIIAIIEVVLQMLFRINIGVLQGTHRFNIVYNLNTFSIILNIIAILLLLYFNLFNIITFTISRTGSKLFTNTLTFYFLKNELFVGKSKIDFSILKEVMNLGISSLIISTAVTFYRSVPVLLFGKIFSISNVLIYSIPMSLMLLISKFINIIFVAAVPKVSELKTLDDNEQIYRISHLGIKVSFFINIFSLIFFILFTKDLLLLWLGNKELNLEDFRTMYKITVLLLGYLAFSNMQKINNIIYKSADLYWLATIEVVISVVVLYLFSIITYKLFDIYVFAIGMLIVGLFKILFYKYIGRNKIKTASYSLFFIIVNSFIIFGFYYFINCFNYSILIRILIFLVVSVGFIIYFVKIELNELEKEIIWNKLSSILKRKSKQ